MTKTTCSLLFLLLLSTLLLSACRPAPQTGTAVPQPETPGILSGTVLVAPFTTDFQPKPGAPTPPPEVFTSRALAIYTPDGKTLVKKVNFSGDGTYQVELPAGAYTVDLDNKGVSTAEGLPKQVVIRAGEVTRMNVRIDTGMR